MVFHDSTNLTRSKLTALKSNYVPVSQSASKNFTRQTQNSMLAVQQFCNP